MEKARRMERRVKERKHHSYIAEVGKQEINPMTTQPHGNIMMI